MNNKEQKTLEGYLDELLIRSELLFVKIMNKTVGFRIHCEEHGFYFTNEMIFQFFFDSVFKLMDVGIKNKDMETD